MQQDSFFSALLDPTFTKFITTKWIQVIYIIGIIFIAWIPLFGVAVLFLQHNLYGLIECVLSFGVFLLLLIGMRMYLEMFVVFFRIEEHTRNLAPRGSAPSAQPMSSGQYAVRP